MLGTWGDGAAECLARLCAEGGLLRSSLSSDSHPTPTLERWQDGHSPCVPSPQLFKGKFYHCLGVDTRNITNRSDCMAANYRWVHHKYNFDNLGQVSSARLPLPYLVPPVGGLTAFTTNSLGL